MILENPMSLIANILKCRLHAADQNGCKWRPIIVLFHQLKEIDSKCLVTIRSFCINEASR